MENLYFLFKLVSLGIGLFILLIPFNLLFILRDNVAGEREKLFLLISTVILALMGTIIIYYSLESL